MSRLSILLLVFAAIGLARFSDGQVAGQRIRRGASNTEVSSWPSLIPYTIDKGFAPEQRAKITEAVKIMAANTCIDFQEDNGTGLKLEYVFVARDNGVCGSPVGDSRDSNHKMNHPIELTNTCASAIGSVHHETMHALGFEHTQSRSDRGNYVKVDETNIIGHRVQNYRKLNATYSPTYGIPFEYGSRMMYNPYHFAIDSSKGPIIVPHDESYLSSMGAAKTLTFYDWKMLNIRYNCTASCTTANECKNGGYQHPRNCSRCICSDFYDGRFCENEKGVIELQEGTPKVMTFNYTGNYTLNMGYGDWANFHIEPLNVIKAPKNRRIRITIEEMKSITEQKGKQVMPLCPETCIPFAIEIADEDLAFTGKKFCCKWRIKQTSFLTKSNIIGYRAYTNRGFSFESKITFTIDPEIVIDPHTTVAPTTTEPTNIVTTTVEPTTTTTIPPTTVLPITSKPTTTVPAYMTVSPMRPELPKPEFDQGECKYWNTFSFNEKAGRCLANSTKVCNEQEWEAANAQSYKACKAAAPFLTSDDDRKPCGLGKVYERVHGESTDALYGRRCSQPDFCTRAVGTCVQGDATKAHCCVLPRYA